MSKITPEEMLSSTLTKGEFVETEEARHKIAKSYWNTPLTPIDVDKFGIYFTKIIGKLNSIVKKSDTTIDRCQLVVKDRIGIRRCDANGKPTGNARYAMRSEIYGILMEGHTELICKGRKRKIVEDFYKLKLEAIHQFHDIAKKGLQFIDDQVIISDAYNISSSIPSNIYTKNNIGHLILNTRIIPKSNVILTMDGGSRYKQHSPVKTQISSPATGDLQYYCHIKEARVPSYDGDDNFNQMELFNVHVSGKPNKWQESYKLDHGNFKFDGIDVNAITDLFVDEMDALAGKFDEGLEALKQKYIGEFLLNEICDSDNCAI